MRHGIACREADRYEADGVWYCERCNRAVPAFEQAKLRDAIASARLAAEADKDGTGSEVVE